MKKTITIITMLTLVFAMVLTGNVNAAAEVEVTVTETVAAGGTVEVKVAPAELLEALQFTVVYDDAVLTLTDYALPTGVDIYPSLNDNEPNTIYVAVASGVGAIDMPVTLTFTVNDGVESGETEIEVTDFELAYTINNVTHPEASVNTVVIGEAATEEPPVENPTEDPTEDPTGNSGETGLGDEKPDELLQTGANLFAYTVAGIVLVAVLALIVKAKKD